MRWLKSIWSKCQSGLAATLLAGAFLFWCLYQLSWALTEGTLEPFLLRRMPWISYPSHPILFVISLLLYCVFALIIGAIFLAAIRGWFEERRLRRRLRSQPRLDDAIRKSAEDR